MIMLAITSDQRIRRDFVKDVRKLHKEHFHLSASDIARQNQIWKDWLKLKQQEPRDLRNLLLNEAVGDAFKARALTILLAPKTSIAPFEWKDDDINPSRNHHLMLSTSDFTHFSPTLRRFLFHFLPLCMEVTLSARKRKERESLFFYNNLVVFALGTLSENDPLAEELFSLWKPLDPTVFYSMDAASGYDHVSCLLRSEIPVSWKWKAHEQMKVIIISELSGEKRPRAEHEDARRGYHRVIDSSFYCEENFPYEIALFADQVEFLIGPGNQSGSTGFKQYHSKKILDLLQSEAYLDLRRRFARYAILGDHGEHGSFGVYDTERLLAAQKMLSDATEEDVELKAKLETLIAEGRSRVEKAQSAANAKSAKLHAVLARMKD